MSTVYYTHKGEQIHLGEEIGRGGEGPVYSIHGSPSECAKIYSKKLSFDDHEKLRLMVNNPPNDPSYSVNKHRSIAWPSSILYADSKKTQLSGFVMPKVDKVFKKALVFITPNDRRQHFISWQHLFVMARNISSAIAAAHERGYCIGDINESNILIAPDALITLIDCDSFQVRGSNKIYRCPVGKDEYNAPELQGKSPKDVDRTFETDNFALSVILFQLLMEGFHPFSGKWQLSGDPPQLQDKMKKGLYPYGRKLSELAPQPDAPSFEIVHPDIQMLFYRCFVDGHSNPQKRPSSKEWLRNLDGLMGKFKKCPKNENHRYLEHLQSCPWCNYEKDSFPSYTGHQVALINPNKPIQTIEERIDYLRTYIDMALSDGALTSDEKDYIIDIGSKLQIPQKEIEKLLNAEIKKCSARLTATSSAGTPKLEISRTNFNFSNLRAGTTFADSFTINNVGSGTLSGTIKTNKKWLKATQNSIDTSRHKQDISFHVDATGLPFSLKDIGTIEIHSNCGMERVFVSIALEDDVKDLNRFRTGMTVAGLILGGLLGFILYSFPCYAKGSGFYDFTYDAALICTIISVSRFFDIPTGIGAGGVGFLIIGNLLHWLIPNFFFTSAWALIYGTSANLSAAFIRRAQWRGDKNIPNIAIAAVSFITLALIIIGFVMMKKDAIARTTKVSPPAPQATTSNAPQRASNTSPRTANNANNQLHVNQMHPGASASQDNSHFTVEIKSNPRATFYIDEEDRPRGKTPLTISLPKSSDGLGHFIRFEAEGHKAENTVIKDGQKNIYVKLPELKSY